ncbi:MAG: arsenate reductase family protein [Oligoflexus sp.]
MKPIRIYEYQTCSTCRKARQFLAQHDIPHELLDITAQAPSVEELKTMAQKHLKGDIKKLFNTSGQEYRRLGLKDKVSSMTEDEAYKLLSKNGMLVKRPFALHDKAGAVGFRSEIWEQLFLKL